MTQSPLTLVAGEALAANRRVKVTGEKTVSYADASDDSAFVGVTIAGVASGEVVGVALKTAAQTFELECADAVAAGAAIYAANDGEITDTTGTTIIGYALEAGAAGDIIDCILV